MLEIGKLYKFTCFDQAGVAFLDGELALYTPGGCAPQVQYMGTLRYENHELLTFLSRRGMLNLMRDWAHWFEEAI